MLKVKFESNVNSIVKEIDDHEMLTLPLFERFKICSHRNLVKAKLFILLKKVVVVKRMKIH